MGKVAKEKPVKAGGYIPKAGNKRSYKAPPPLNPEKQRAREAGEQQFQSEEQFTVPSTKVVLDKKTMTFITKLYNEPVAFRYDENRKQFVYGVMPVKEKAAR